MDRAHPEKRMGGSHGRMLMDLQDMGVRKAPAAGPHLSRQFHPRSLSPRCTRAQACAGGSPGNLICNCDNWKQPSQLPIDGARSMEQPPQECWAAGTWERPRVWGCTADQLPDLSVLRGPPPAYVSEEEKELKQHLLGARHSSRCLLGKNVPSGCPCGEGHIVRPILCGETLRHREVK